MLCFSNDIYGFCLKGNCFWICSDFNLKKRLMCDVFHLRRSFHNWFVVAIWKWGRGGSTYTKESSNLRRRKNFVQHQQRQPPCSRTYRQHFLFSWICKKNFKEWREGQARPAPPFLQMFITNAKKKKILFIRAWTRGLFPFLFMLNKAFSTS